MPIRYVAWEIHAEDAQVGDTYVECPIGDKLASQFYPPERAGKIDEVQITRRRGELDQVLLVVTPESGGPRSYGRVPPHCPIKMTGYREVPYGLPQEDYFATKYSNELDERIHELALEEQVHVLTSPYDGENVTMVTLSSEDLEYIRWNDFERSYTPICAIVHEHSHGGVDVEYFTDKDLAAHAWAEWEATFYDDDEESLD